MYYIPPDSPESALSNGVISAQSSFANVVARGYILQDYFCCVNICSYFNAHNLLPCNPRVAKITPLDRALSALSGDMQHMILPSRTEKMVQGKLMPGQKFLQIFYSSYEETFLFFNFSS